MKWNKKINLSAARTHDEVEEHIEDSRAVLPHLGGRVLDVGSGGGFPVLVAARELPTVLFVALEPIHKKHAFLREAARSLRLPNLEARCERLEDHEVVDYDVAMSRATFDLVDWLRLGSDHIRIGGKVLAFEGVARTDLPAAAIRHPYSVRGKSRAIIELIRASNTLPSPT
nr:RsmG family class I SAM-dependent methyltransferase [Kofleriaceae bacterium]